MLFGLVGNKPVFSNMLEEHQAMVYSIALHYLRDGALAEDTAQEVFLQLHKAIGSLESAAHAKQWLRKAAVHRSIDQLRRMKTRPQLCLEDIAEPSAPAHAVEPWLGRMLDELPEKARMVVILRYQEDLDPLDIAALLDMPVATVKSHLHRSLEFLRGRLKGV